MIKFNIEKWDGFYKDAYPLMKANSEEINIFNAPLEIDVEIYEALEEIGHLKCFTARENGVLVGYAVFTVSGHINYTSKLIASQIVIYVKPEFRTLGIRLIKHTEVELKKLGAQIIVQGAPVISRLGVVLERLGYKELETLYSKEI